MELIETHDTLYIITCGLAMRNGQLIRKGDVWNEDFLLPFASSEEALQRARCVTAAFSYIEVLALSHEAFFQELAGPALVLDAAAEPVRATWRDALDGLAGTGPRRAGGGGQPAAAVGDGRAGAVARDDLDTSQAGFCLRRSQLVDAGAGAAAVLWRFCTGECCCQQGCEQWHVCERCSSSCVDWRWNQSMRCQIVLLAQRSVLALA